MTKLCVLVLFCVAGSTMLLRETSLMPHIPGLPALLSMLFAPVMELRWAWASACRESSGSGGRKEQKAPREESGCGPSHAVSFVLQGDSALPTAHSPYLGDVSFLCFSSVVAPQ